MRAHFFNTTSSEAHIDLEHPEAEQPEIFWPWKIVKNHCFNLRNQKAYVVSSHWRRMALEVSVADVPLPSLPIVSFINCNARWTNDRAANGPTHLPEQL